MYLSKLVAWTFRARTRAKIWASRAKTTQRLHLEQLEERNLLSNGAWLAVFNGIPGANGQDQTQSLQAHLSASGVTTKDVSVVEATDSNGTFLVQTPTVISQDTLVGELNKVPGFVSVNDYASGAPLPLRTDSTDQTSPGVSLTFPDGSSPSAQQPAGPAAPPSVGTWAPLASTAPFSSGGGLVLLSDGTVMAKSQTGGSNGNTYYKLTPNSSGSYVNGTWTALAPMPDDRLYYSTQMLMNGNVYVAGGEYGTGKTTGAVYNPLTNAWTATPVSGHTYSDANSEILPNGNVLQALVEGGLTGTLIYNPTTNTYSNGPSALGITNESAWVKLPDDSILFVNRLSTSSERYIPASNTWIADANVPVALYDSFGDESGAGFLLPNGKAFFLGSTGTTAIYTPSGTTAPGSWVAGANIPLNSSGQAQGTPDAAGAMMSNGKLLFDVSPIPTSVDHFPSPTAFYEYDYTTNTYASTLTPTGGATLPMSTYVTTMLDLPNGAVLYAQQGSSQFYVYTPSGSPLAAGQPTITSISPNGNGSYHLVGTQLNGISEGAAYGDDWQMATNYPIVRLTSGSNVYYARTFNWSSTGVMTGNTPVTTEFTLPTGLPFGSYSLVVTANGIASNPVSFNLGADYADTHWAGLTNGTSIPDVDPVSPGLQPGTIGTNAFALVNDAIAAAVAAGTATVIVNGDDGSGNYGNFNEAVSVPAGVSLTVQYGPASFNSLSDISASSTINLNGVTLTEGSDNTSTQIVAPIAGTGSLTKIGSGVLTLSGTNSYTGATTVNGGVMLAGSASAFGSSSATTVGALATLRLNGFSESIGSLAGSGTVENASATPATLTVGSLNTATSFSGTLQDGTGSGALSIVKSGSGSLTLSNASTYGGTTTISGGALLFDAAGSETGTSAVSSSGSGFLGGIGTITAATAISSSLSPGLSTGSAGTLNTSSLLLTSGKNYVVDLNSASSFDQVNVVGTVNVTGATLTINANYTAANGDTYVIINNDGSDLVTGTFNGLPEGTIAKIGSQYFKISYVGGDGNDVVLTAIIPTTIYVEANWSSFTSGTIIADADPVASGNQQATYGTNAFSLVTDALSAAKAGDIIIVNAGAYNEDVVVNKQVSITFQQGASSLNSLADTVANASLQLSGIGLTVGSDNASTQFSSPIGGAGSITKVGTGTMTLSGIDSAAGGATINGGVLLLGSANVFSATSPVTVNSGGVLRLNGINATLGSLAGAGTVDNTSGTAATLTVGGLNTNPTFSGVLQNGAGAGSLGLTKTGSGTLSLTGASSSYTGVTTINSGTLSVSTLADGGSNSSIGASSNAAANLVLAGGTLQYLGTSVTTNRNLTLTGPATIGVSVSGTTLTVGGSETGAFAFTMAGPGTLAFSTNNALNSVSGITVSSGRLQVAGQTLSSGLTVSITSGATFASTGVLVLTPPTANTTLISGAGTLQLSSTTSSANNPDISYGTATGSGYTATIASAVNLGAGMRFIKTYSNLNPFSSYGGDLALSGAISGTAASGITLVGVSSGTTLAVAVLSGNNAGFLGTATVASGELILNANSALTSANSLTLNPIGGATSAVYLNGHTVAIGSLSSAGAAGTTLLRNGSTTAGSLTITQTANAAFAGVIGDSPNDAGTTTTGALTLAMAVASNATLTLSGTNTYTGTTTVNGGVLAVSSDANLGTAPSSATAGKLTINGGTLLATSTFALNSFRGIAIGPSSGSGSGEIDVASAAALTYGGIVANNSSGTGALKIGSGANTGTLVLSGANTYAGVTTINAGVLSIGADNNLGAAPGSATAGKLVINAGTLLATNTITLNSFRGIAMGPSSGSGAGEIDVASSKSLSYGGIIANNGSGTGALTDGSGANNGTLILSGANTYAGVTTINAGVLSVSADNNLGAAPGSATVGKLVINTGTLLATNTFTLNSFRGMAIGPSSGSGAGELDVAAGSTLTYGGIIANNGSGVGGLTIGSGANTGKLVLSGINTYSNATSVNAGTLLVIGSLNSSSAVTVATSATLGGNLGTVGPVSVIGNLIPGGPARLTTGQLSFAATGAFGVALNGANPGTGYDQVVVTSASGVNLSNNPTLNASTGYTAASGDALTIIKNQNGGSVTGTFNGKPEGSVVTAGTQKFTISYVGGTSGHDVVLTTATAPVVTTQPTNQTVTAGSNATFTAAANGNPAPTVQWQVSTNGGSTWSPISGATSPTLTLTGVTIAQNNNQYEAVFTNGVGNTTTSAATLTVNAITTTTSLLDNGPNPSNVNVPVSYTVNTTGVPDGQTVNLEDFDSVNNNLVVGSVTINTNAGSTTVSTLAVGGHHIFAVYAGDLNHLASQSAQILQTVLPAVAVGSININAGTAPIISASSSGNMVTITTDGPHGFAVNDPIVIVGLGSGFDGDYQIASVAANSFTYIDNNTLGTPATNNGTATDTTVASGLLINGTTNQNLPGSASFNSQRSMVDSIVYTFNQAVNLAANAFTLTAVGQGGQAPSVIYSSPDGGVTWVVTFSGTGVAGNSIANGEYQIVLNAPAVSAVSGGGTLASNDTESFYRMFGDTVGNGHQRVNGTDNNTYLGTFGLQSTSANFLAYLDFDVNGKINGVDNNSFLGDFGTRYSGFTATI